jgi:DNA replication protein DnaC
MTTTRTPPAGPAPGVDAELKTLLRRVKLGRILDTLPERLALARADSLPHSDFLTLVLADEVERRDRSSAELRARAARLDPSMRLETFSSDTDARLDRQLWTELCSLRFVDDARGALVLGPVGVGKTHLATALGHIAVRRRRTVAFYRADQLFRRLKAARLDNTVEAEMRRLARVDLLILDDLALQAMDSVETADFYELVVERHHKTSTIVTSNRDPSEWIALMSDPLLAQSAVDRLVATSYELVVEGESYRRRQRPTTGPQTADNGVS